MKRILICLTLSSVLYATPLKAQDATTTTEQLIADIFEQFAAESDESIDYETFYEELLAASQHPLNLNNTTKEELEHLPFLSDVQIENILFYLYRYGPMQTIFELQLIDGIDMTDIRRMLPFVVLGKAEVQQPKIYWRDVFKYGKSDIMMRISRGAETKEGYYPAENDPEEEENVNSGKYIGSQFYNSTKYHFRFKDRILFGLTAEKDAGEQFMGSRNKGYDFYSAYAQLNNIGKMKRIVLGDYRANFGLGLVLHPDFGMGKSSYVLNVMPRNSGLKKFSSTDEYNFFRGVGATLKTGKMDLTAFYSLKNIDGDTLNGNFTSIYKTGLHRTSNEFDKKHTIRQQVIGGNATLTLLNLQVGLTAVHTRFDHTLMPEKLVYNYFYFSGNQQTTAGMNYRYRWHKMNLFGETAIADNLALATINGFSVSPLSTVSLVVLHRYFSPGFDTFYANTFSESTRVNNETGMYIGAEIRPFRKWKVAVYSDSYRFPWTKFTINAPSNGMDYLLQTDFAPHRNLNMFWRFKYEQKMNNASDTEAIMPVINPVSKTSLRYQLVYSYGNFSTKTMVESNLVKTGHSTPGYGVTALQDLSYKFKKIPLRVDFRYQFFDAVDYENRFYTYEKDILYAFSIPMYYGSGSRYYVNLKYELTQQISIWFKIAQTAYTDERETIGTGNEELMGNRKTDFNFLIKWEF
ncbi:MAG TPA: helix-hairpin-helix domain-containing protein [Paludibacter sp.]|nr:helix-hairpin-helix domain-containing protein [Paludibacter sp.]